MPDLSILDSHLINRLIPLLLFGEPNISPKATQYRRIFIRLIDKALREYNEAREHFLADVAERRHSSKEMIKKGRRIYSFGFADCMENCINAISRLFKLLDRISSEKDSLELPRSLRRLLGTKSKLIKDIRDSIEHIDEQIQKDEISPGNQIMLFYNDIGDGIAISNFDIKYQDLASILNHMHEIALYLMKFKTT